MATVSWRVRAIRGAITVPENTAEAIRAAVTELLDEVETHNDLDPREIVSLTF
ncbi:MAG: chorismate mutase, partial [Prochlorothrix sp.]